jgi:hypothetical protein
MEPMKLKCLDAKAGLLQRITDAVSQSNQNGLRDAPGMTLKALKAGTENFM